MVSKKLVLCINKIYVGDLYYDNYSFHEVDGYKALLVSANQKTIFATAITNTRIVEINEDLEELNITYKGVY